MGSLLFNKNNNQRWMSKAITWKFVYTNGQCTVLND